ncbi:MBL fold metallo-hydrolase [Deinococcus hopiensis]|uniref:MBL fold metallo-hydrolase n=1 Tax=Deinococcus hopiensis TaxID=309885 RepID=UPI00111BF9EF
MRAERGRPVLQPGGQAFPHAPRPRQFSARSAGQRNHPDWPLARREPTASALKDSPRVDLILVTHGHEDHFGAAFGRRSAGPKSPCPPPCASICWSGASGPARSGPSTRAAPLRWRACRSP